MRAIQYEKSQILIFNPDQSVERYAPSRDGGAYERVKETHRDLLKWLADQEMAIAHWQIWDKLEGPKVFPVLGEIRREKHSPELEHWRSDAQGPDDNIDCDVDLMSAEDYEYRDELLREYKARRWRDKDKSPEQIKQCLSQKE